MLVFFRVQVTTQLQTTNEPIVEYPFQNPFYFFKIIEAYLVGTLFKSDKALLIFQAGGCSELINHTKEYFYITTVRSAKQIVDLPGFKG